MPEEKVEHTRTRQHGTEVTRCADYVDSPGQARIAAVRKIVKEKQYAKVDGVMVDLYSASAIVKVYDALSEVNRKRYRDMPIARMAGVAFKLLK